MKTFFLFALLLATLSVNGCASTCDVNSEKKMRVCKVGVFAGVAAAIVVLSPVIYAANGVEDISRKNKQKKELAILQKKVVSGDRQAIAQCLKSYCGSDTKFIKDTANVIINLDSDQLELADYGVLIQAYSRVAIIDYDNDRTLNKDYLNRAWELYKKSKTICFNEQKCIIGTQLTKPDPQSITHQDSLMATINAEYEKHDTLKKLMIQLYLKEFDNQENLMSAFKNCTKWVENFEIVRNQDKSSFCSQSYFQYYNINGMNIKNSPHEKIYNNLSNSW